MRPHQINSNETTEPNRREFLQASALGMATTAVGWAEAAAGTMTNARGNSPCDPWGARARWSP